VKLELGGAAVPVLLLQVAQSLFGDASGDGALMTLCGDCCRARVDGQPTVPSVRLMRVVPLGTHSSWHWQRNASESSSKAEVWADGEISESESSTAQAEQLERASHGEHPSGVADTTLDKYAVADALTKVIQDDISLHHLTNKYLQKWLDTGLSLWALEEEWLRELDRVNAAHARVFGSARGGEDPASASAAVGSLGVEYRIWDAAASLGSLIRWLYRSCPCGSISTAGCA
jgi:hypothetical protein